MNGADGVARVILSGKQHLSLSLANFVLQALKQGAQFIQRRFIFFGEFKEHSGIRDLRFKFFLAFDYSLKAAAGLQEFLGRFLIRPKVRRRSPLFSGFQICPL